MYFRSSIRRNPLTGELSGYYRLVESYRNGFGKVCHRTILTAGFIDELNSEQLALVQKGLNEQIEGQNNKLFQQIQDPFVKSYIDKFFKQMIKEKRVDKAITNKNKDWQTIDINTLKNKEIREVGAEWMCFQAAKQLGIDTFLLGQGWTQEKVSLALTHMVSRAVYPASEFKTSRWARENSAICEITGYNVKKVTKDKLYHISHALYHEKDALEQYLSLCTNELFDLQDKIILYDLTNTYFEGEKRGSQLARFGRSKEKRSDARLVVMAVVVNTEGLIKYYTIYEGNKADCKTLADMIDRLRLATSATEKKALVVIDAGIATDQNLEMISKKGYDYLCVSRSNLKEYTVEQGCEPVFVTDKKNRKIELAKVKTSQNSDYYLKVKSQAKEKKESAMNSRFKDRFEEGLKNIEGSLHKKSGVKKIDRVHQRIGRLKQKYPSIHRFYQIDVQANEKDIVTSLTWSIKQSVDPDSNNGIYFLRTSLIEPDQALVWTFYNTIREIEYTFRVLKTDLDLRPIFHQTDDASKAHLHLGLLAYWLVNTIRFQLKQKGVNSNWREIVRVMNTQKCVTTTAQNNKDEVISIRKCSEPEQKVKLIYDTLKYKYAPFIRKKSVVLKLPPENFINPQNEEIMRR